ncbi:hypothetical protein EDB92DRAFT_1816015 [Lactarius akahatsu]|uniref:Transmembrane protein n=1 Tax=Lactarius akahatsu TaxID=416441 RepID=A0AAD4LI29_9AGAM|nr:hypothetical protein EDB92DRAFT_1816015 [Lactarius akahatsu]
MTDWKSPAVVTAEYCASLALPTFLTIQIWVTPADALVKLYHVIGGVLIWEFVVNIGFEYSVFTGKRKFRSSFLVRRVQPGQEYEMINSSWYMQLYLGARWFPMFAIIGILVRFDSANRINCQLFSYPLDDFCLGPDRAAHIFHTCDPGSGVTVIRATWSGGICKITNPSETKINFLVTFVTDLVLLALMLTGLLRWENARQRGGVWWLLYTQGLAWMIIVVVAEALVTVTDTSSPGFRSIESEWTREPLITMTICASRVYRGLADYFLYNEANMQMSGRLSEPPIKYLVPRSDQSSLALGPSGMPDGHMFGVDPLAPPKHHSDQGKLMKYGEIELCSAASQLEFALKGRFRIDTPIYKFAVDTRLSHSVHLFIGVCAWALARRVNQPPLIIVK